MGEIWGIIYQAPTQVSQWPFSTLDATSLKYLSNNSAAILVPWILTPTLVLNVYDQSAEMITQQKYWYNLSGYKLSLNFLYFKSVL